MNLVKLYLLHFDNINKFYDTCVDKKEELASRVPGFATIKSRFILNCLWWAVVIIEPFLSILIVTGLLPYFLFIVIFKGSQKEIGKYIGLCYHGLARQRFKAVNEVYDQLDYYLYPIFVDKTWVMPDKEKHNVLEQVRFFEVIKAYLWSVLIIFIAAIKTHGKYLYRNHVSYEYLLTYYFLQRTPAESSLYFVNHLDRWALLFNMAPQNNKVLLQHGIERPTADWPVKLTNVNKAYVFAESQKERMKVAVLGNTPEFLIMPPTITLTNMPTALNKNIVIVAGENYMYYDKEEYIIKKLKDEEIRIYVKIHPGKNDFQKYIELQKKVNKNVEVITTPTFPQVNVCVSHFSTLGLEYEAHRIPVLYYDGLTLDEIVKRIVSI